MQRTIEHSELINLMQELGYTADDEGGVTSLHVAAQKGHLRIVEALIEAGAQINKEDKDY